MRKTRSINYTPRSLRRLERKSKRNLFLSIGLIVFFLYLIIAWGLPALIGGLSVFNKFKPSSPKPSAIEDSAIAPPVLNIPYEATNSASIRISGYATPQAKVEIYLDDELKTVAETDENGNFTSDNVELALGNNNISSKTVLNSSGDIKKSLASKSIRLIYSNEKPKLDLSSPSDNQQIKGGDKKITVSGTTDPSNNLTINGSTIILNQDGGFSKDIQINDGDNTITVVATDSIGNSTKIERKVNYSAS